MGVETIYLSQTLEAETWVEASEDGLRIHASRHWLAPLLRDCQCAFSIDILYPVQQLDPSLLHLAMLLHEETCHSSIETSAYAVELAKVLSIHVLRAHYQS